MAYMRASCPAARRNRSARFGSSSSTWLPGVVDKPAEYAASRIPHYWRVEHDLAEQTLSVFCYRLDPTTGTYASAGVHTGKMTVTEPVPITIDLSTLL
jgi:hypothetical protein